MSRKRAHFKDIKAGKTLWLDNHTLGTEHEVYVISRRRVDSETFEVKLRHKYGVEVFSVSQALDGNLFANEIIDWDEINRNADPFEMVTIRPTDRFRNHNDLVIHSPLGDFPLLSRFDCDAMVESSFQYPIAITGFTIGVYKFSVGCNYTTNDGVGRVIIRSDGRTVLGGDDGTKVEVMHFKLGFDY